MGATMAWGFLSPTSDAFRNVPQWTPICVHVSFHIDLCTHTDTRRHKHTLIKHTKHWSWAEEAGKSSSDRREREGVVSGYSGLTASPQAWAISTKQRGGRGEGLCGPAAWPPPWQGWGDPRCSALLLRVGLGMP